MSLCPLIDFIRGYTPIAKDLHCAGMEEWSGGRNGWLEGGFDGFCAEAMS